MKSAQLIQGKNETRVPKAGTLGMISEDALNGNILDIFGVIEVYWRYLSDHVEQKEIYQSLTITKAVRLDACLLSTFLQVPNSLFRLSQRST